MVTQINNIDDVLAFFKVLYKEGVSAHPDNDFNDYISYETKEATYSLEKATLRNELMNKSFEICDKHNADIYDLMIEVYNVD